MAEFSLAPNATKYQPINALALGKTARLAYDGRQKIKNTVNSWGFGKFEFFDRGDTQAFVAGKDNAIIVAFRGTQPDKLQDWVTDADFELVDGLFGKVHDGFYKSVASCLARGIPSDQGLSG